MARKMRIESIEAEAVFVRGVFAIDESWELIFRDPAAGRPPMFTWSAPLE